MQPATPNKKINNSCFIFAEVQCTTTFNITICQSLIHIYNYYSTNVLLKNSSSINYSINRRATRHGKETKANDSFRSEQECLLLINAPMITVPHMTTSYSCTFDNSTYKFY